MFKREFHLDNLLPPDKGFVQLEQSLSEDLGKSFSTQEICQKLEDIAKDKYKLDKKISEKVIWEFMTSRRPWPLWLLLEALDMSSQSIKSVEDYVKWYRFTSGKKIFPASEKTRRLPVRHDVYFDCLAGMIDSAVKNGQLAFDEKAGRIAYDISKKVFGDFILTKEYTGLDKATVQLRFPSCLYGMIKHCHASTSNEPKENVVAYNNGVIFNKGTPTSNGIIISRKNEQFLAYVSQLFEALGLNAKISEKESTWILKLGMGESRRFYSMVDMLLPWDIRYHPDHVQVAKQYIMREKVSPDPHRREKIRKFMREGPKTVMDVSMKMGLSYFGAYSHIKDMEKNGEIKTVGKLRVGKRPVILYGLK